MNEINLKTNKKRSSYFTSIVFLLGVIVVTVLLYFYNSYLLSDIEKIKISTEDYVSRIAEVEKDKNLQVYSLLEINKEVISNYEKMNSVTNYISHLNYITTKYNIDFSWFNLSKWELETKVSVISNDKWIAFNKTRDFIEKYRVDEKALFDLGFISLVEWMDNISFNAKFKIK